MSHVLQTMEYKHQSQNTVGMHLRTTQITNTYSAMWIDIDVKKNFIWKSIYINPFHEYSCSIDVFPSKIFGYFIVTVCLYIDRICVHRGWFDGSINCSDSLIWKMKSRTMVEMAFIRQNFSDFIDLIFTNHIWNAALPLFRLNMSNKFKGLVNGMS